MRKGQQFDNGTSGAGLETLEGRVFLAADTGTITGRDAAWVREVDRSNQLFVRLAELAQTRSTNTQVQALAGEISADAATFDAQLDQVLAVAGGDPTDGALTNRKSRTVEKIAALSGADFDRAFVNQVLSTSQSQLKTATRFTDAGKDTGVRSLAAAEAALLQDNIADAGAIGSQLVLDKRDVSFMQKAAQSNLIEISAGNLAATKGRTAQVRAYGAHMVTDHTTAQQQLSTLASSLGVTLPTTLPSSQQRQINRLSDLDGAAFDRAHTSLMVSSHRATLANFVREDRATRNSQIKAFTSANIPVLQAHLTEATALRDLIAGGGGDVATTPGDGSGGGAGGDGTDGGNPVTTPGTGAGDGTGAGGTNTGTESVRTFSSVRIVAV